MVGFLHLFLIILKLLMRIKIPAKLEKNRREEHFTQENIPVTSKQLKGFEDAEYSKKEPYVIYYIQQ